MNKREVLEQIQSTGIVPVIRTKTKDDAQKIAEAIVEGGINCLEITMTVPGAVELIKELTEKFQASVLIGAGTVLDENAAQSCIAAGAKFIVTPYLNLEIINCCREAGVLICAGALTPTEIYTAWRAGADIIKVFPVSAMGGANYLKAVKSPFPNIRLMPTGGISLTNVSDFIEAGAFAVGVGGEISNAELLKQKGKPGITRLASLFREVL